MVLQIEHSGPVVHVRFGDGGDNLFAFDECSRLIELLCDPPAGTRVLRLAARMRRWFVAVARGPGLCPACGYDLRATPDRCPECGTASIAVHESRSS